MERIVKAQLAVFSTALLIAISTNALASDPSAELPIQLAEDPSQPVIVLDFPQSRRADDPSLDFYLAIYADGRATVTVPGPRRQQLSGQIPRAEFQQLLAGLLVEHQLLHCQTSRMQQEIASARRERQRPQPGHDAATTLIRVHGADSSHEVRCHALGLTASQLPDLPQVCQLFACQQRLENVATIIRAGGYEKVNEALSAANQKLQQQAPRTDLLTCRELSLVDLRPDGTRYLQFSRLPDTNGLQPAGGFVMVSVYQAPGQPPEITVTADAS